MSKQFLAIGDYLINPELLAYAILEGEAEALELRLGFASPAAGLGRELRLTGEEARHLVRWLRLNAAFLTRMGGLGPTCTPQAQPPAATPDTVARSMHPTIGWRWDALGEPERGGATRAAARLHEPV
jgi:hypothetical protein